MSGATGSMLPLEDDPSVPEGAVFVCEVLVTQYIRPDSSLGIRTSYRGDGSSVSTALGMLILGGIHLYERASAGPEPGDGT